MRELMRKALSLSRQGISSLRKHSGGWVKALQMQWLRIRC